MTEMSDAEFKRDVVEALRSIRWTLMITMVFTQMACYQSCSTTEYLRHDLSRPLAMEPRDVPQPTATAPPTVPRTGAQQ